MVTRECWRCHRIGRMGFVESTNGITGWCCAHDRACRRRQDRTAARRPIYAYGVVPGPWSGFDRRVTPPQPPKRTRGDR